MCVCCAADSMTYLANVEWGTWAHIESNDLFVLSGGISKETYFRIRAGEKWEDWFTCLCVE